MFFCPIRLMFFKKFFIFLAKFINMEKIVVNNIKILSHFFELFFTLNLSEKVFLKLFLSYRVSVNGSVFLIIFLRSKNNKT